MASSVAIPQDIIDNVIEAVGNDKHLLKKCALVSSSFLRPSRKQLFSKISLSSHKDSQGFHQFLVQNPVIQSFVRSIAINERRGFEFQNSTSLLAILRLPFSRLESFSITLSFWHHDARNWNSFSCELKDTLSNIIHSPTLKTLYLKGIVNVPITLFLGVHLTNLELDSLSPDDFDGEQSSSLTPAASKGVATTTSHTVIDQCIWSLWEVVHGTRFPTSDYFSLIGDMEGPAEPIFLPFMCRLRYFEININPGFAFMVDFDILSFLMRSLCVSLTSPATLEHLKFKICFRDTGIDNYGFYLRDADAWSHLDSIITHPTGSRLQRVDIHIEYSFRYDDDVSEPDNDEILEAVLDALPLLREKGILFVEAEDI